MVRRQDPREARCLFSSSFSTAISPWLRRSLALGPVGRMKRSIIRSKSPSPTSSSSFDFTSRQSIASSYRTLNSFWNSSKTEKILTMRKRLEKRMVKLTSIGKFLRKVCNLWQWQIILCTLVGIAVSVIHTGHRYSHQLSIFISNSVA